MLFKVTHYLTVVQYLCVIDNNLLFEAGNNLIVETETPIKTEDLNPGSNGGGQQLGNNDQLSILPHGQEEIHSPSSSVSSSNALVGFDPSKRSFTEEELRPSPIRTKTKKRAVPDNEKDSTYWERVSKILFFKNNILHLASEKQFGGKAITRIATQSRQSSN